MPKNYNQVREEYLKFRDLYPDDPTDLPSFAKQLDQAEGTPGERAEAYHDGMLKRFNATIDRGFEATGLPDVTGAAGEYLGSGFDSLAGTKVAPVVKQVGQDLPRAITESLLTIPEGLSGVGLPVAIATWLNRARKIAGYGSAALQGMAHTDSPVGGVIGAGALAAGNKLIPGAGNAVEKGITGWLEKQGGQIIPEAGKDVLSATPRITPYSEVGSVVTPAAKLGTEVAVGTGINEATRQGNLSVGPEAVGPLDPRRNPLTVENIAANVAGSVGFAPQMVGSFLGRSKFNPLQAEKLAAWKKNRAEANLGYDEQLAGPLDARAFNDKYGHLPPEQQPRHLLSDTPLEDYWTPENLDKTVPYGPEPLEERSQKLRTRRTMALLDAYSQASEEGSDVAPVYKRYLIKHIEEMFPDANPEDTLNTLMADGKTDKNGVPVKTSSGLPESVADLTHIQNITKGQTNAVGLYKTTKGKEVVVKSMAWNPQQLNAELFADVLYQTAGVPVPASSMLDSGAKVAEFIQGKSLRDYMNDPSYTPEQKAGVGNRLREGFAMDALLGNWDVIGLNEDNIIIDSNHIPWRVDNGGSFEFRAQGGPKVFENTVPELVTMRDATVNPQAAKWFSDLSPWDIYHQITDLDSKRNEILSAAPDRKTSGILAKRLDFMVDWAEKATQVDLAMSMKAMDSQVRLMPEDSPKGIHKFLFDVNDIINQVNENTISFDESQKTPANLGKTWHPNARDPKVIERLQKQGLIEPITEDLLREKYAATFDELGNPQFAYHVVLQKVWNDVLAKVPQALDAEKNLPKWAENPKSKGVTKMEGELSQFVDALAKLPPDVRQGVLLRTKEIFSQSPLISKHGKTSGRLVSSESSWRKAVINAANSYDPETKTILIRTGKGKYERTLIRSLVDRDPDSGEYIFNPVHSAVPIGEGGKSKTGGKPEANLEDLTASGKEIDDDVADEEAFKQALAAEGGDIFAADTLEGKAVMAGEAGPQGGKEGFMAAPDKPVQTHDFLKTPLGKATAETFLSKKDKFDKVVKSLSPQQLYDVVRDAFVTKKGPHVVSVKDPFEPTRRTLLPYALNAAMERLNEKGEGVGPAGKEFLTKLGEYGSPKEMSKKGLDDAVKIFFKFKTPVENPVQGVPNHYARLAQVIGMLLDDEKVNMVRGRKMPGMVDRDVGEIRKLISDDVDPNLVMTDPQGKVSIFYHGSKHSDLSWVKNPENKLKPHNYQFISLATNPKAPGSIVGSHMSGMFPVLLKRGKYWDYENPEHIKIAEQWVNEEYPGSVYKLDKLKAGEWSTIEDLHHRIKNAGFDGFFTFEYDKNVHTFSPDNILYLTDAQALKKGKSPFFDTTGNPLPEDVVKTFQSKFRQVLENRGYAGSWVDVYTEMATALALQLDKTGVDFYRLASEGMGHKPMGLAAYSKGRGKIGLDVDQVVPAGQELQFAHKLVTALAHEIQHIDEWIIGGHIPAPDAYSEDRRTHVQNFRELAKLLSPDERQAILQTLSDVMEPESFRTISKNRTPGSPDFGKLYGRDDPVEFTAGVTQLIAKSLLLGKSKGMMNALEALDYSPTEVREYARGTYRTIADTLDAMHQSILDPTIRGAVGKESLPFVNLRQTADSLVAVIASAREGSKLRNADHLMSQARAMVSSMSSGAGMNPPMPTPAVWKVIPEMLAKAFPEELLPEMRAMANAEDAIGQAESLLNKKATDKSMKPGIWARVFYPFANLMEAMKRDGFDLARPVWNLAENLETGVTRLRSSFLRPFLKQNKDGSLTFDQENALIRRISEEPTGHWRDVMNKVSAWQNENVFQEQGPGGDTGIPRLEPMFIKDENGVVGINKSHFKDAQSAWDSISKGLSEDDKQVIMSASVAMDEVGQRAAMGLIESIDRTNRMRVAGLLMTMNKGMPYDQAMVMADDIVGSFLKGVPSPAGTKLAPEHLMAVQDLLLSQGGLIPAFLEVKEKLLNRPGFRTESLPGDYIVRFKTPDGEVKFLSAESEKKATWLAGKLTNEGNTIFGEIVHKNDLKSYTDFDSPDVLLHKFSEVEGHVWDSFTEKMRAKYGDEMAKDLQAFVPGAKSLKEMGTKGISKYLLERKSEVDRTRYDYIDGTMTWAGRLAASIAYRQTRMEKDLILQDRRARMFPSFKSIVDRHFDELMQPSSQLSKELKAFTTAYMLGGSIASATVEGTQSLTTLTPVLISLNQSGGPIKAWSQIGKAIGHASWVSMSDEWQGIASRVANIDPKQQTLQESMATLYRRAVEDGGINHGVIEDLMYGRDQKLLMNAKFGHGDYGPVTTTEMVRSKVYMGGQMLMKLYSFMSVFNNKISFLAGVEQGYAKGLRGDALYDHAKLVKTLSTYGGGKANVPGLVPMLSTPYTRSGVAVVNALQQYGYGIVATYAQLAKDSLGRSKGLTSQQRAQAQKAFGTMLATQVAVGGALGLPFAAASLTALEKLFGVPANELVREGLASLGTDDDQGAVIAETALNGLGNQMFGLDVSSRLGVSNLLGTSSYRGFNIGDMVGPVGSILENMVKGLNWFGQGEPVKGFKELVPNAFKTIVEMSDSRAKYGDSSFRDAGGNLTYNPTKGQAAAYLLGFRPKELSEKRQLQRLTTFSNERTVRAQDQQISQASRSLLAGDRTAAAKYVADKTNVDPTIDARSLYRSIISQAVDSQFEKDVLASGPQANEQERVALARTFGKGVVTRRSEMDREQAKMEMGMQFGLRPDPQSLRRAALMDSLVEESGMARSEASRLVEFLTASTHPGLGL